MKRVILTIVTVLVLAATVAEAETPMDWSLQRTSSLFTLTFGTPAALNWGYTWFVSEKRGYGVYGGYLEGYSNSWVVGIQVNTLWRLHETRNSLLMGAAMIGTSQLHNNLEETDDWNYVGVGLSARWQFFFAETGLSVGTGTYANPQMLLQLGFVLHTGREK